jgi:hypothetical protein
LEILTSAIPGSSPGGLPQQVFVTLNGTVAELEALAMAIQKALSEGPQVFEVRTANGIPVRMLIDRLGPAQGRGA